MSHLGKLGVRGPGAGAFVDGCLTNALGRIGPGRAQYSLCCDEASGGVVDDLIVYLRSEDDVLLVPNAANAQEVARRLAAAAPAGVEVTDEHEAYGVLAVQGPRADDVLDDLGLPVGMGYMSFADATWRGVPLTVCRTGYTGERGYELLPPAATAGDLWEALLERVRAHGGLPCGLGARDTLRTEMGYPLHGHELTLSITPVQARTGWAVGWSKPAFWGRDVLLAERERGAERLLWGLLALDRGVPRPELPILGLRRRDPRSHHLGHLLADPAPGHRPRAPAADRSRQATRSWSTSAAGRCAAAWSSRPSCRPGPPDALTTCVPSS